MPGRRVMPEEASLKSAFGYFLVAPAALTHSERIGLLISAIPGLRFGDLNAYTRAWLADAFESWLRDGGDLERHLGLRPVRGSRRRAACVYAIRRRDQLLLQLSTLLGSDAAALRALNGADPRPERAAPILEELSHFKRPHSAAAFTRARARISRHG